VVIEPVVRGQNSIRPASAELLPPHIPHRWPVVCCVWRPQEPARFIWTNEARSNRDQSDSTVSGRYGLVAVLRLKPGHAVLASRLVLGGRRRGLVGRERDTAGCCLEQGNVLHALDRDPIPDDSGTLIQRVVSHTDSLQASPHAWRPCQMKDPMPPRSRQFSRLSI